MLSAEFTINETETSLAQADEGSTVELALTNKTGIKTVTWSVFGLYTRDGDAEIEFTKSGTPTGVLATFEMPDTGGDGYGVAVGVRCVVKDVNNEQATHQAIVWSPNASGRRPYCPNESTEAHSTQGWVALLNENSASGNNVQHVALLASDIAEDGYAEISYVNAIRSITLTLDVEIEELTIVPPAMPADRATTLRLTIVQDGGPHTINNWEGPVIFPEDEPPDISSVRSILGATYDGTDELIAFVNTPGFTQ